MSDSVKGHGFRRFARLAFVESLLYDLFELQAPLEIEPIAYDKNEFFEGNNHVFAATMPSDRPALQFKLKSDTLQPGCDPIPDMTRKLIVRLANPVAMSMNTYNRIENEVACIRIASEALQNENPKIVPSVYAWCSAAQGSQGWTIQQFMPGAPLNFGESDEATQRRILKKVARIVKAFQQYELPPGVTGPGGLTFDENSSIISSREPSIDEGPWPTYESTLRARLKVALKRVEDNPWILGWRQNGIRKRLDEFIDHGLASPLRNLEEKERKCLVHCDLNAFNLLYDEGLGAVTAVIDFDFSHISHPLEEFLRSFRGTGDVLAGWTGNDSFEETDLRRAKLSGVFPDFLPQDPSLANDMRIARLWEQALEQEDVLRPSTIAGIANAADIDAFLENIEPWRLTNLQILDPERQPEASKLRFKAQCETSLLKMLERMGY